jgi:hypothetical protein
MIRNLSLNQRIHHLLLLREPMSLNLIQNLNQTKNLNRNRLEELLIFVDDSFC